MKNLFVIVLFIMICSSAFAKQNIQDSGFKTGYQGLVEIGYSAGIGDYGMNFAKINFIYGYRINHRFSLGLGTGFRYSTSDRINTSMKKTNDMLIPLFLDFRSKFKINKISPYFALDIGYSFNARRSDPTNPSESSTGKLFKGFGYLLSPSAGISFKISEKSSMNLGISYEIQQIREYLKKISIYQYKLTSVNAGTLGINVGISF